MSALPQSIQEASGEYKISLEHLRAELSKMRTGVASPALVEDIKVMAYGSQMPLRELATINVPEPRVLAIQPWDANVVGAVETALAKADLGMQPVAQGNVIRLTLPQLTAERRHELVKQMGKLIEEHKQRVRKVREDLRSIVEDQARASSISEDEKFRVFKEIDRLTQETVNEIEQMREKKEAVLTQI